MQYGPSSNDYEVLIKVEHNTFLQINSNITPRFHMPGIFFLEKKWETKNKIDSCMHKQRKSVTNIKFWLNNFEELQAKGKEY